MYESKFYSRVNNDEICLNIHTGKRHQILNLYKNKNKNLFKLKSFSLFFLITFLDLNTTPIPKVTVSNLFYLLTWAFSNCLLSVVLLSVRLSVCNLFLVFFFQVKIITKKRQTLTKFKNFSRTNGPVSIKRGTKQPLNEGNLNLFKWNATHFEMIKIYQKCISEISKKKIPVSLDQFQQNSAQSILGWKNFL